MLQISDSTGELNGSPDLLRDKGRLLSVAVTPLEVTNESFGAPKGGGGVCIVSRVQPYSGQRFHRHDGLTVIQPANRCCPAKSLSVSHVFAVASPPQMLRIYARAVRAVAMKCKMVWRGRSGLAVQNQRGVRSLTDEGRQNRIAIGLAYRSAPNPAFVTLSRVGVAPELVDSPLGQYGWGSHVAASLRMWSGQALALMTPRLSAFYIGAV